MGVCILRESKPILGGEKTYETFRFCYLILVYDIGKLTGHKKENKNYSSPSSPSSIFVSGPSSSGSVVYGLACGNPCDIYCMPF